MSNSEQLAYPFIAQGEDKDGYGYKVFQPGLTKREYFAAMAMQGILADSTSTVSSQTAEAAVNAADLLINELEKIK